MEYVDLKFLKRFKDVEVPAYATTGSSGMDVKAYVKDDSGNPSVIGISPGQTILVKTGLKVIIPSGYELQVRSRSGLTLKSGIVVANSPGTIDSDYRGEIGIILHNISHDEFLISHGDRVAQLVINQVPQVITKEIFEEEFENTDRAEGGFGSTGKN